jgi:hypothetical protein
LGDWAGGESMGWPGHPAPLAPPPAAGGPLGARLPNAAGGGVRGQPGGHRPPDRPDRLPVVRVDRGGDRAGGGGIGN